jgi:hypothetical protein
MIAGGRRQEQEGLRSSGDENLKVNVVFPCFGDIVTPGILYRRYFKYILTKRVHDTISSLCGLKGCPIYRQEIENGAQKITICR